MTFPKDKLPDAYRQIWVIRKFEEAVRALYMNGQVRGSFHPCVGQEATAVGGCWALRPGDYMTCTYRGHGHAIAKGLDPKSAMAEMLGKATGCSKGKGGSMHFTDPSVGLLGANAIVAAGIPHAAGAALAARMQGEDRVALTFFGEGAVNQGVYFETLNLSVVWKLPVIFVCENNRYSEMTPSHETTSNVDTYHRAASLSMPAFPVDGNDVEAMYAAVEDAADRARKGGGPTYLEAETYRLWGHMMGDPEIYRTKDEVFAAQQREPALRLSQRLQGLGFTLDQLYALEAEAQAVVDDAVQFALQSPVAAPAAALEDVFSEIGS